MVDVAISGFQILSFGLSQVTAGQFDRRIKILRQSVTLNDYNEPVETYTHALTLWAQVRYLKVDEIYDGESVRAMRYAKFMVRWRTDITDRDRIEHDGRTFKIIGIVERGRRELLEVLGEYVEGLAQ